MYKECDSVFSCATSIIALMPFGQNDTITLERRKSHVHALRRSEAIQDPYMTIPSNIFNDHITAIITYI